MPSDLIALISFIGGVMANNLILLHSDVTVKGTMMMVVMMYLVNVRME